ncbi:MAG: serine/threonine protein kinase [Magnetococcales bacterium]|nr:serine/threonine protein kinase [Magnetococcales bacterium]
MPIADSNAIQSVPPHPQKTMPDTIVASTNAPLLAGPDDPTVINTKNNIAVNVEQKISLQNNDTKSVESDTFLVKGPTNGSEATMMVRPSTLSTPSTPADTEPKTTRSGDFLSTSDVLQGRYRIIKMIGRGGFSSTYLARDLRIGIPVVAKEARSYSSNNTQQIREIFKKEAQIASGIIHKNLARVTDFFNTDNKYYIIMDFIEGEDLSSIARRIAFDEESLMDLLRQLLTAVKLLHSNGIIHRDIKPSNIIIKSDRTLVLVDFGAARQTTEETHLTSMITFGYSPPEQYSGSNQGAWSDIYSIGATLYELTTRIRPADSTIRLAELSLGNRDPLLPASSVAAGRYSQRLLSAIDKSLSINPKSRPSSISEFEEILGEMEENDLSEEMTHFNITPPKAEETNHDIESHNETPMHLEEKFKELSENLTVMIDNFKNESIQSTIASKIQEKNLFTKNPDELFNTLKNELTFYRKHLNREYKELTRQAKYTYYMWILVILTSVATFCIGVFSIIFLGKVDTGLAASSLSSLGIFIHRIFQQREDHYRELSQEKQKRLTYGEQLNLIVKAIEGVDDSRLRSKYKNQLLDNLFKRLNQ